MSREPDPDKRERRFQSIMDSMQEIVFTLDVDGRHTGVYGPWVARMGQKAEHFLGRTSREILGPEAAAVHEEATSRALAGEFVVYEWSVPAEGRILRYQTSLSPIRNESGKVEGIVGIGRDITERYEAQAQLRRQLEDKSILLRETHHRIKNSFLAAESLLGLQASKAATPEAVDALKGAQARIAAMRILYQKILEAEQYRRVSLRPYLESLAESILTAYAARPTISMEYALEDIEVDSALAFPLGSMAAEILTNSFKHAFSPGAPGRIRMALRRLPGGRGLLRLEDDGAGIREGLQVSKAKSFGMALMRMMTEQMGGAFRVDSKPGAGTVCEVEFPLTDGSDGRLAE